MKSRSLRTLGLIVVSLLASGGCSGGCSSPLAELPAPIPGDQTIEGGIQIRVTKSGFETMTSMVPTLLEEAVADGFCIPQTSTYNLYVADVYACGAAGYCGGGVKGCQVNVDLDDDPDSLSMTIVDKETFRIDARFDLLAYVPIYADWVTGGTTNCTLTATLDDARLKADLHFGVDDDSGELKVELESIQALDISDLSITGCSTLGSVLDSTVGFVADVFSTEAGNYLVDTLSPFINDMIQSYLPDPMGIEGLLDVGALLSGTAPGVKAELEVRAVPGGYVSLPKQGLSLGVIVGLNSDSNPETRAPAFDSEPSLCVPSRPAPVFALLTTSRDTLYLSPADEFLGESEPAADLAIGVSETVLDLGGHHAVSSGAMCMGIGSSTVPQLNVATIGFLVPSLAALTEISGGTGKEPVLLVMRPQKPIDVGIGSGTDESPRIQLAISEMEIDFYAFLYERYVRAFTMSLNMDIGLNVDFTTDDDGNPSVMPTILGLDSETIAIDLSNAEFLAEDPDELEALFPTLFDLIIPIVSESFGSIPLPVINGFTLDDLQVDKVTTTQDDFLAIYATLASVSDAAPGKRANAMPVETKASVVRVTTPSPETIRTYLHGNGGALPTVELDLSGTGAEALEWQWSTNGGLWHPFSPNAKPILADRAFAVQGRHLLRVRARKVGDYRTVDQTPVELPIVFDSVGPKLFADRIWRQGDEVIFPANDAVSEDSALEFAFADGAFSRNGGRLSANELESLVDDSGNVEIRVRDEVGNTSTQVVNVSSMIAFHGQPSGGTTGCHITGAGHTHDGDIAARLLGIVFVVVVAARRRLARAAALLAIFGLGISACADSTLGGGVDCTVDEECSSFCTEDTIPICEGNTCLCSNDIPLGLIGAYSDLAVDSSGRAWVSAYNEDYGDLMIGSMDGEGRVPDENWEFVDGIPDGPIVLEGSETRGGIRAEGNDVGRYTSLTVTNGNTILVSYYDASSGSMRFSGNFGGTWTSHVVDQGTIGGDSELGTTDLGRYSSMTLDKEGRPGIAYLAILTESSSSGHTELRFAQALTSEPVSSSDWEIYLVDEADLPVVEEGEDAAADLPKGVGLFVDTARRADDSPILAYYDRVDGDLKVATFDVATGSFNEPETIDGDDSDVGWYPSIAVSPDDTVHISYIDAENDDLLYVNLSNADSEVIDDGFRVDGTTSDGYPKPVYHLIGDDSSLIAAGALLLVAYQDGTTHELVVAERGEDGTWARSTIAGDEDPYVGAYGFYVAAAYSGGEVLLSSYVINQLETDYWVEIFRTNGVIP